MKKSLLFFLFIISIGAKGQTLVRENKYWQWLHCPNFQPCRNIVYKFSGDTIISSKTYKKLYVSVDDTLMSSWQYSEAHREDSSKKVYQVWGGDTTEHLLYDFNLNVNDTFYYCNNNTAVPVVKIDTITLLNGEQRKRFLFDPYPNPAHDEWIEGIGSILALTWSGAYYYCVTPDGGFSSLRCFSEDNIMKYEDSRLVNNTMCFLTFTVDVPDVEKIISLTISPNPFHTTASLTTNFQFPLSNYQLRIFDVMGRLVKEQIINQQSSVVNRENLLDGIYFYQLTNGGRQMACGKFVIN